VSWKTAAAIQAGSVSPTKFMKDFGGACRSKHTIPLPERFGGWARLARALASGKRAASARVYPVRTRAKLPAETIRLDPWEAEYVFTVAATARVGIVEIGRYKGGSTFLLASANRAVPIWSIDKNPLADDELRRWFERFRVGENVSLLVGNSRHGPLAAIEEFDLLFIDGAHSYEGVREDLGGFYPRLAPGGSLLLHDCYGGHEVQLAVLDFLAETDAEAIRSPYIPAAHWRTDFGSIAHLRKPRRF
jgi:predicted O-methyltransferase YrrM